MPTLVLLPGLGADAAIYRPQIERFGDRIIVPPWIDPKPNESIDSYARRLGRRIEVPTPFYIGGISFGGMMAAEIAQSRHDDVAGLLMFGSCTHRSQVTAAFRFAAILGPHLPRGMVKGLLNRLVPRLFGAVEGLSEEHVQLLEEVAYRTDVDLLAWGATAIRSWTDGAQPTCPTYFAHGADDVVIPPGLKQMRPGVDLLVPGGKHLIHLSHADIVNRWVASKIDGPSLPASLIGKAA